MRARALLATVLCGAVSASCAEIAPTARLGPGVLSPMFPPSEAEKTVPIAAFEMDRRPVTNAEFLRFVRENPRWRRDRAPSLLADEGYLSHWSGPEELGPEAAPDRPVTRVSWFAAKACCAARAARLPTWNEWEFAAAASETEPDARDDPEWQQRILAWYSDPSAGALSPVGRGAPNYYGLYDMHGLVWEWVLDFNAIFVAEDSREGGSPDKTRFCGAGTLKASDASNYAVFMRTAMLSALKAQSTTANLGFRCARDAKGPKP